MKLGESLRKGWESLSAVADNPKQTLRALTLAVAAAVTAASATNCTLSTNGEGENATNEHDGSILDTGNEDSGFVPPIEGGKDGTAGQGGQGGSEAGVGGSAGLDGGEEADATEIDGDAAEEPDTNIDVVETGTDANDAADVVDAGPCGLEKSPGKLTLVPNQDSCTTVVITDQNGVVKNQAYLDSLDQAGAKCIIGDYTFNDVQNTDKVWVTVRVLAGATNLNQYSPQLFNENEPVQASRGCYAINTAGTYDPPSSTQLKGMISNAVLSGFQVSDLYQDGYCKMSLPLEYADPAKDGQLVNCDPDGTLVYRFQQ